VTRICTDFLDLWNFSGFHSFFKPLKRFNSLTFGLIMTKKTDKIFHVISNTHWDREWRFPFQRNRQMLVDMIDAVLEILEKNSDYRAFHLDSQSIVLKDYLEIKPQKEALITKLTLENRLLHGPWYILPEEFQVGGENLIRNLLLGHETSRNYGGVSKIGYSPFSWGQISQLPQIYKQFNIDLIMFYRGINSIDSPKSEFLWEGADGTRMVSSRFSTMPRYNFYFYIYRPAVHNEGFYDVEHDWQKGSTPFHFADALQKDEDYFIISPHTDYYPETIQTQVEKIINDQADDFTTPHVIWMEGHDSSGPNAQTVQIIKDIRSKFPGLDVRHSTLEEYAAYIAQSVDVENLKLVEGERRSAQNNIRCGNLFGYTTSARMYLKQANFDAERWIQYYAEPFNVFSAMAGRDINDRYTQTAWELIVQNSAHDSIGGCSLDRIHEDMMLRYNHSIEISKGVFERALKSLVWKMNSAGFENQEKSSIFLCAINATNFQSANVVEAFIDIPQAIDKGDFKIFDSSGQEVKKQIVERKEHQPILEQMINRPMHFNMVRYSAFLDVKKVPPFGMKLLQVIPSLSDKNSGNQINDDLLLENDNLKISFNADGTFNVLQKNNGFEYKGVGYFEDKGDAGHAWVLKEVGKTISTKGTKARIFKSVSGPVINEVTVVHEIELPQDLKSRVEGIGPVATNTIELRVKFGQNSKYLELAVKINNLAESHRLRLMIPTGLVNATHSIGEGQFDVVKRTLDRPDTTGWLEQPMYDFPMHHFVDLDDGSNGIAVLVDGLKEYEVLPDDAKTLAITLLRTFEYKINPAAPQEYSFEKGAQMLGESTYRLAIYPHLGNWQQANVFEQAHAFNYPLRLVQTGKLSGNIGHELSFMEIEPKELVFSTIKLPENQQDNSFVLRLYNPTQRTLEGRVNFLASLDSVTKVSLEEIEIESVVLINENSFGLSIEPKKIFTFLIKYKQK